jgi:hypothetical protein
VPVSQLPVNWCVCFFLFFEMWLIGLPSLHIYT